MEPGVCRAPSPSASARGPHASPPWRYAWPAERRSIAIDALPGEPTEHSLERLEEPEAGRIVHAMLEL